MSADASGSDSESATGQPVTGDKILDDALAELARLDALPLTKHPDRLGRAHEALRTALEAGPGGEPSTGGQ
jgi:hypothetical protein